MYNILATRPHLPKAYNTPTCCILCNCLTKWALLFGLTYLTICFVRGSKVASAFISTFRICSALSSVWLGTRSFARRFTDYRLLKRSDILINVSCISEYKGHSEARLAEFPCQIPIFLDGYSLIHAEPAIQPKPGKDHPTCSESRHGYLNSG